MAFPMTTKDSPEEIPSISSERVAAFRLTRHHLAARAPVSAFVQVTGDMGGAQAQVMSAAQMSLGTRTQGLRATDVEKALWQDRTLARVWCMRGTVYLVPSEDFAVFVRGVAGRADRDARWMAKRGRSIDVIERIVKAMERILDRPLTRKELSERLGDSVGTKKRVRLGHGWGHQAEVDALEVDGQTMSVGGILSYACIRGVAVAGPPRGNESTYVRPAVWLPKWRDISRQEAEDELLLRYLRAHGPATVADFTWWTYVTAASARAIWKRREQELVAVNVGGRISWILRDDLPTLERAKIKRPLVRLLPFFDSFLLGHQDKGHLVERKHYQRVYRPQGWLSPVVLVDGSVKGIWKSEKRANRLSIRVEPFGTVSSEVRDRVEEEGEALGKFLEADSVRTKFAAPKTGSRP